MIGFHLASRRRANIGLMADDVRSTTQPLPVKIAVMEICTGVLAWLVVNWSVPGQWRLNGCGAQREP
ncbi:hypothetical protein ES319_A07G097900v1 [Gossypium barbadense]|uniref:Uncharacterized protein n=2 Tax=Gossypium TaxID=3633 RepID=A0A5J5V1G6_GOSBA|nr:hypothetical protein ES319_A07G097900v1 [Gossypium barbadense]TYH09547.1 hypothetical protein ES288_A07G104600v1 [Gossypium darwinii]